MDKNKVAPETIGTIEDPEKQDNESEKSIKSAKSSDRVSIISRSRISAINSNKNAIHNNVNNNNNNNELNEEETEEFLNYDDNKESFIDKIKNMDRLSVMMLMVKAQVSLHTILAYNCYLVVPYYVLSDTDWGVDSLGYVYSAASIGEVVGSQIVPLAASLDSDLILFGGHLSQFIGVGIGYILMSGLIITDYWVFCGGMFLIGYSFGLSAVQAYSTTIANGDEEIELSLMSAIGRLYILSSIAYSFVMPNVYSGAGFEIYCFLNVIFAIFGVVSLLILLKCFKAESDEYNELSQQENEIDNNNNNQIDVINEEDNISENSNNSIKSNSSSSANSSSADIINENNTRLSDSTSIGLAKTLSPSMYALLLIKGAQSLAFQIYSISYPVVFTSVFKIEPDVAGTLYAIATFLGFVGLFVTQKLGVWTSKWDYPFDIGIYFGIAATGFLLYPLIWSPLVGYIIHPISVAMLYALSGMEMTTRLYLCPTYAFQKLTGIIGFLQASLYLTGSFVTPHLLNVNIKFPFYILSLMCFISIFISIIIYFGRRIYLNYQSFGSNSLSSSSSYLSQERAYYSGVQKSSFRRGGLVSQKVTLVDDMEVKLKQLQSTFARRRGMEFLACPTAAKHIETFANNVQITDEINSKASSMSSTLRQSPHRQSRLSRQFKARQSDMHSVFVPQNKNKNNDNNNNNNGLIPQNEIDKLQNEQDKDKDKDSEKVGDDRHSTIGELPNFSRNQSNTSSYKGFNNNSNSNKTRDSIFAMKQLNALSEPTFNNTNKNKFNNSLFRNSTLKMNNNNLNYKNNKHKNFRKSIIPSNNNNKKNRKNFGRMSIARASTLRRCEPAMALSTNDEEIQGEVNRRVSNVIKDRKSIFF